MGLALGGGGARGIAHIGAIIALEEAGVPIDIVAGTSMGSIVGGLYAAGYTGERMRDLVGRIDWPSLLRSGAAPGTDRVREQRGVLPPLLSLHWDFWDVSLPSGLIDGQRVYEELLGLTAAADLAADGDFGCLAVPYRAMAVDVTDGTLLALDRGSLARALQASSAIPMIFEPVDYQGHLLVDGGVLDVLPTDVVREMGADVVLAVELERMADLGRRPANIVEVGLHTFEIMIRQLKRPALAAADVLVQPDLGGHDTMDFSGLDSLIQLGYEATVAKLDQIAAVLPRRHWTGDRRRRLAGPGAGATVVAVEVEGNHALRRGFVLSEFGLHAGEPYDPGRALAGLRELYATGFFRNVWLSLARPAPGRVALTVHVVEDFPRTLDLGARWRTDLGWAGFVQLMAYDQLGLGERILAAARLGEVRDRAGLDVAGFLVGAGPLSWRLAGSWFADRPYLRDGDGDDAGRLDWSGATIGLELGLQPRSHLLLSAGLRAERLWQEATPAGLPADAIAPPLDPAAAPLPPLTLDDLLLEAELQWDGRDRTELPTRGTRLLLGGRASVAHRLAGGAYRLGRLELEGHWSPLAGHVVSAWADGGAGGGEVPLAHLARVGGPFAAPGLAREEMWGRSHLVLGAGYRLRVAGRLWPTLAWAAGRVGDEPALEGLRGGLTAGVQADTPFGPAACLLGLGEAGRRRLSVSVGHAF